MDIFFTVKNCQSCYVDLQGVRTQSWFNDKVICMDCAETERTARNKLRDKGMGDMEGCGMSLAEVEKLADK